MKPEKGDISKDVVIEDSIIIDREDGLIEGFSGLTVEGYGGIEKDFGVISKDGKPGSIDYTQMV